MASRCFSLLAFVALAAMVVANKAPAEEPLSIATLFQNLNTTFQKAATDLEGVLGIDIPSTQEEVKTALQDNVNNLQKSAQTLQQKLAEYNVTGSSLSSIWDQIQTQVNSTVDDLAKRNPDVGKLLTQVKTGYNNLVEVSKRVSDVVQEQAGAASDDLKNIAQQARTELSKAATQLEAKVQEVIAENQKKSKTS